jgi:hypothetical protein
MTAALAGLREGADWSSLVATADELYEVVRWDDYRRKLENQRAGGRRA